MADKEDSMDNGNSTVLIHLPQPKATVWKNTKIKINLDPILFQLYIIIEDKMNFSLFKNEQKIDWSIIIILLNSWLDSLSNVLFRWGSWQNCEPNSVHSSCWPR